MRATPGSLDGILSRLPKEMSVVTSAQALGWENILGVITAGRLEDFFDYSAPFHIVAFWLKGAGTLEWKRGTRFTRFHARPGELLITPAGEANSIRQPQPIEAFICCLSPDRLQSLAEQEWEANGQTIEILAGYHRDAELWSLGERWPREFARRSLARASLRRLSSPRSRSGSCGTIRPCGATYTRPR